MFLLNGQLRPVQARDRSIESEVVAAEKADRSNPGHVPSPFAGTVAVSVEQGQAVEEGDTVATIEAMKMEAAITAPRTGKVARIAVTTTARVEGGDLLLVIE
ncbi:biotin/lipoyl-containing protein [Segniliparus rugosus]|nr:biotin/lipoyl-containing protein [Segniliparus rugosus]